MDGLWIVMCHYPHPIQMDKIYSPRKGESETETESFPSVEGRVAIQGEITLL